MRRGFKTWAEKLALEQRSALTLGPEAPLPARLLASYHDVVILEPAEIPGIPQSVLNQLLGFDSDSWSALSFERNGQIVIIHNPVHSPRRQESNLMHELAHVLCNHEPSHLVQSINFPFALRTYNSDQEEEARWLGGCLQLPRAALMWAIRHGMNNAMIVKHYGASVDLVRFRRQITGIDRQMGRR
jgi:hypothetical protein